MKYANFAYVFSKELAEVLPEKIGINKYTIELIDSKQLFYGLIYSLALVEFKTMKTYIETNSANGFIEPSKSLARALILFV